MPDNLLRFILMINVTSSAFPSRNTVITLKARPGTSLPQHDMELTMALLIIEVCAEPWTEPRVRTSFSCILWDVAAAAGSGIYVWILQTPHGGTLGACCLHAHLP